MEESPQSTEALTGKLHELLTDSDNDAGQFSFQEEMIEEVMQEFYKEIARDHLPKPASPPPSYSPNTSSIKNASCGASVSDSASKMMAGIQVVSSSAGKVGMPRTESGSPVVELEDGSDELVGFGTGEEKKTEGCDGGDFDDEWLERVLSWGQGQVVDTSEWF